MMAMDVKLTQIHQDEFSFFSFLTISFFSPSSHHRRPVTEPSHLLHPFPERKRGFFLRIQKGFLYGYELRSVRLPVCARRSTCQRALAVEVKADEVGFLRDRRWPWRTDTV